MVTEAAWKPEEEMAIEGYAPALAAQMAAVFLIREGGSMDKLKLVKLLYLAERESIRLRMRPIFYDENFSLPNGPAGTNAIDGVNHRKDKAVWCVYTDKPDADDVVTVRKDLVNEDFGDLSDFEIGIAEHLSTKFRHLDGKGLRDYTHDRRNVPEYEEPAPGRRKPITDEAMAEALKLGDAREYALHVAELRGFPRGRDRAEGGRGR